MRSLYFLFKNYIPHTTAFQDIIQLQIDNGMELLKKHKETCPSNATYSSPVAAADFLTSISSYITEDMFGRLKKSKFFSIMADESTDTSSKKEYLSVANGWKMVL